MIILNKYIVHTDDEGIRIDRWLRRKFNYLPQSFIQKKLRKGFIILNGKNIKANKIIKKNDIIEIKNFNSKIYLSKKLDKKISVNKKDKIKFISNVIYDSDNFLIFNKWKGISTQGGAKKTKSIDNIIKSISLNMNLVHRLDKNTSGALIISKNYQTSRYFGKLFKERKINKIYFALCLGLPKKNKGVVNLNIIKSDKKAQNKMISSKFYQESITRYELLEYNNGFSMLIFIPLTGRRHQIRMVAKYLNCPILGDNKYYQFKQKKVLSELMLHSFGLSFYHNKKHYKFFAPIPKSMEYQIQKLGMKIPKKNIANKYV